jgi:hypothetical protein
MLSSKVKMAQYGIISTMGLASDLTPTQAQSIRNNMGI